MQYTVVVVCDGLREVVDRVYTEARATALAQKTSRKFTSATTTVEVHTDQHKRGYPKCYRMGRLFRI